MPQISVYVNQDMFTKIVKTAKIRNQSVSKWVRSQLQNNFKDEYPAGFFTLFGSAPDETMVRPEQISATYTIRREAI